MSIAQYQLSWNSHDSNVCNGFTKLQQNEEFVDMTLAADGHLVKVHKNIFALASPYIKSMLQSSPSEHPIIFLGSVSHEVLNYILTYVYTGEVSVEAEKIQLFMRVAKDLRLSGLFNLPTPQVSSKKSNENFHKEKLDGESGIPNTEALIEDEDTNNVILEDMLTYKALPEENFSATEPTMMNIKLLDTSVVVEQVNELNLRNIGRKNSILDSINIYKEPGLKTNEETPNKSDAGLYTTADGYQYKLEIKGPHDDNIHSTCVSVEDTSSTNIVSTPVNYHSHNFGSFENEYKKHINSEPLKLGPLDPKDVTPQYTISSRGSFQLILNRYMYYCHHQSHGGRKRRWRCIDYRSKHCPAFIDTDRKIITSRKFGHVHSFHDEKIRKKMERDLVVTDLNTLVKMQSKKDRMNMEKNEEVGS